jgi:hypothetical protein
MPPEIVGSCRGHFFGSIGWMTRQGHLRIQRLLGDIILLFQKCLPMWPWEDILGGYNRVKRDLINSICRE